MIGETVGQYRLISELGRGRFGTTYRAEHLANSSSAVLKQLDPDLTQGDQFQRRFTYETDNLVRLYHSNLASILGLIVQNGNYFIVSEDLSGPNLAEYLNRKEKLNPTHAAEIVAELCTALDYLHKRHYYHQHLHPGNVLITKDGKVKLTDFGLAGLVGEIGVTKVCHKPAHSYSHYLAPEQKLGQPANELTDIYPLGVLLYELITGTQFEPRKTHPLLPTALQKIIARATAEEPKERAASVADLSADLTRFLNLRVTHPLAPVIPAPAPIEKRSPPNWWLIWGLGLAILLALPLYYLFRVRGISEPSGSVSREIPFQREMMPYSRPIEESLAQETTETKEEPKKPKLIKEESEVGVEHFQPLPSKPSVSPVSGVQEETQYTLLPKEPERKETIATESGESLNIPKEDNSIMPETITPVPSVMVVVPGGEFIMGSDSGNLDERSEHRAFVNTFLIDAYEVSNAQYKAFIDANSYPAPAGWKNRLYPAGQANYPVTKVSWSEASSYAAWVGCRLPTEAEWEKAARGSDGRTYPWGNQFIDNACNYLGSNYGGPTPVGIFPKGRSPFGGYDMAGNIAEWTADVYQLYAGNPALAYWNTNPGLRVVRGGAFDSPKDSLRTAARAYAEYTGRYSTIGFRTVRSLGGIPAIAKKTVDSRPGEKLN
ncbi:MAG: bifunctional serine/threonine-protein kinase/formylglycine-generating enzyme family protein [bacterium]|nr:bifunctional serine/threonine-protein kinase/formylglycine-generating enzyme family protein [bacterium]